LNRPGGGIVASAQAPLNMGSSSIAFASVLVHGNFALFTTATKNRTGARAQGLSSLAAHCAAGRQVLALIGPSTAARLVCREESVPACPIAIILRMTPS
jgi:hypothetical protein